jgi:hypothetical protein
MLKTIIPASLLLLAVGGFQGQGASGTTEPEKKAVQRIRQLGGLVLELAQNDDRLEVSYLPTGEKFTEEHVAVLKGLKKLVHLNLRSQPVTDAMLVHLKGLTTLTELHLEKTKITSKGLEQLKGLVNLEYLNIYGTDVTDAGLPYLEGLKKLKNLYLWQTKVTDAGVARLKKALPKLDIERGLDLDKPVEVKPAPPSGLPGQGKHIVLISGDEEYRSEEALPQLAKILTKHHGFKCTVLYAIDPKDGTINPDVNNNIPGLDALKTADLMVIFTRFRKLPDDQMKHIVDYVESGKPIIGLRTATHAFALPDGSPYAKYNWNSKTWDGGFGRQVLGETWISHHGAHGSQSTRGLIAKGQEGHPILRGIKDGDIWGPTDVYGVRLPLPGDSKPLVMGQILKGTKPTDPPLEGPKNNPMMPIAWVKTYKGTAGKTARVFTTTMGASQDLLSEGTRRMLVNACYWAIGMEDKIAAKSKVDIVGDYKPRPFRGGGYEKGRKPQANPIK